MIKAADIALSGINANILKMDTASDNIANTNTPGYKAVRVPTIEESSNTNLAVEFTNLILAQRGVEGNMSVIRTSDELLGTLFDNKA